MLTGPTLGRMSLNIKSLAYFSYQQSENNHVLYLIDYSLNKFYVQIISCQCKCELYEFV